MLNTDLRRFILPTPGDVPCPECGYLNTPQSETCGVCGSELNRTPEPGQEPERDAPEER